MTFAQACEALGVGRFASEDDINAAWKERIKVSQPDLGGSDDF